MESKNITILQKSSKLPPPPFSRLLTRTHLQQWGEKLCAEEQGIQYAEQQLRKTNLDVSGCFRSKYTKPFEIMEENNICQSHYLHCKKWAE